MKNRTLLIALALAGGAGLGAAEAATSPSSASATAAAATPAAPTSASTSASARASSAEHKGAAATRRPTKAGTAAMDGVHERVALAREAEQRRWIEAGLRGGALDRRQAASLRSAAAAVSRDQAMLTSRGRESVGEALTLSHRQDLLDWAIRTANVGYATQAAPAPGRREMGT